MTLSANELLEQNLWSYLTDDATVSGFIGTRLYPGQAPQNPTTHAGTGSVLPYGVYRRVDTPRIYTMDGVSALTNPRFQFDWIGGQNDQGVVAYAKAIEIAKVVRQLLNAFGRGTLVNIYVEQMILEDERDVITPSLEVIGRSQDWIVWHHEALS